MLRANKHLIFIPVAMIKYYDGSNSGDKGFIRLTIPVYSPLLEVRGRRGARSLKPLVTLQLQSEEADGCRQPVLSSLSPLLDRAGSPA